MPLYHGGLPSPEAASSQQLRANFFRMSIVFALNHGCATTPILFATSVLDSSVGYWGNATLFFCTMLSSLFVAVPIVSALGAVGGLLFSMCLYSIYATCFALAALSVGQSITGVWVQWVLFCGGSMCAGVAAGVLWTAQGEYFGRTKAALAQVEGRAQEEVSATLAGDFSFWYLIFEVGCKLSVAALQSLGVQTWVIGFCFAATAIAASVQASSIPHFEDESDACSPRSHAKLVECIRLWGDVKIWLIAPLNLTFGFSAAFMNGYVNANFAKTELGVASIGLLGALTCFAAAVFARSCGFAGATLGQGPVIFAGSLCFVYIPLSILLLGCCAGWRWWIITLYIAQGGGRAIYESTVRAVISDMFSLENTSGAFASAMLQSSLSFTLCFILSDYLKGYTLACTVLALACTMLPFYTIAAWKHGQEKRLDSRLLKSPRIRSEPKSAPSSIDTMD